MKCGRTGIISVILVGAGLLVFAPAATAQTIGANSTDSGVPLWIGIATGLGAAAALGFALWPAWRRGDRAAPPAPSSDDTSAVAVPVTEAVSRRGSGIDAERARELEAMFGQARALLRSTAAKTSEQQARSLERVAAQQTQAFLGSASTVRAEFAVLVREWQAELESTAESAATSRGAQSAPQANVARLRVATEAFERLRRVEQQALQEIDASRQEGLAALETSKLEVEQLARKYTDALDEAGAQWLRTLERAGIGTGRRRRRVSPPVVGMVVAVAIVIGAAAFAVGGDNERSGAGPRLRAENGVSLDPPASTVTPTTAPPTTVSPTTTPATTAPAPVTTRPSPAMSPTAPPVANTAPPTVTSPPIQLPRAPGDPTSATLPGFVCAYVPSLC